MKNSKENDKLSISKMRRKKKQFNEVSSQEKVLPNSDNRQPSPKQINKSKKENNVKFYGKKDDVPLEEKVEKFIKKQENYEDEVNLSLYLEIAYQYKYLIFLILVASLIAAFAYGKKQIPVYEASTKIFIQEDLMELQIINNKPMFKKNYDLQTWMEIIKSSEIARRTSERLNGRISPSRILHMISCSAEKDEEHIIEINVTSTIAEETAEVANAVYLALRDYDTESRLTGYENSLQFINAQIKKKQTELDSLDAGIDDFYSKNRINKYTDNMELNLKKVEKFKEMLTTAEVELSALNANIDEIKNKLDSEDSDIISQTTYSEPLKIRLMNLEVDLARALTKYTEKHPKVQAIQHNIANVKKLIREGAGKKIQLKNMTANPVRQNLVNSLLEKEGKAVAIEQKIKALKKIIGGSNIQPEYRGELNKLERQRAALEKVLINLQNQLNEIRLNANVKSDRIKQLQEATVPTAPTKNKTAMFILMGLMLGLALGFGTAFLLSKLDNRIKTIKQFTRTFDIPVIGNIPELKFSPLKTVSPEFNKDCKLSLFDIFKHISLNFKYLILDKNNNTFAISSPTKGEGKSTIAINMALSLVSDGLNVILIDTDFHLPRISKIFQLEDSFGLSEVLSGQASLEDCITVDENSKMAVLPSGKKPPNIPKMLSSENFFNLIQKLKKNYDIVILDTPAALMISETSYIFSRVDGIILVVKLYSTTISEVKKILRKALTTDTEILGAILNNSRSNIFDREYEEYHDYYYYKYKHKYYYHDYEEDEEVGFIRKNILNPLKKSYYFIITKILLLEMETPEEEEDKHEREDLKKEIPIRKGSPLSEKLGKPVKAVLKLIMKQFVFEDDGEDKGE